MTLFNFQNPVDLPARQSTEFLKPIDNKDQTFIGGIVDKLKNGKDSLFHQKKSNAPLKIADEVIKQRTSLVSSMHEKAQLAKKLEQEQKELKQHIAKQDLSSKIQTAQTKVKANEELTAILGNQEALINRLTADQSQTYGALSALAYAEFQKGLIKKPLKSTQNDMLISTKRAELEDVSALGKELHEIAKSYTQKKVAEFKMRLEFVLGRQLNEMSYENLCLCIEKKKSELSNAITDLQNQVSLEQDENIQQLQGLLNQNRFAKHLTVQGIFYRNNGEFSGFAAYDKETHQLNIVFAGSKSSGDWIKNFMGWNAKASSRRGLLTNMNLHAGFLSHLEDLSDEAFEAAYRIIKNLSDLSKERKLTVMGTGHSLGGALATLFTASAKEMADSLGVDIQARGVTFGAPNMVHGASVSRMNELFGGAGNWVRFENSWDPVPVACFWKENPGVAIRYQAPIFSDAAGALQITGQNPHGAENYYHSIKTHMDAWIASTDELRHLLARQKKMQLELSELSEKESQCLENIHKDMVQLSNFDSKHSANLARLRSEHLTQLKKQADLSSRRLTELKLEAQRLIEQESSADSLNVSSLDKLGAKLKQAKKEAEHCNFVFQDAQTFNPMNAEKKKAAKALKKLKSLVG